MNDVKTPRQKRNVRLGEKLVKSLKSRHFEAFYCENSEQALEKILSLIPEGCSVSWGGSATLQSLGLPGRLHQGSYTVWDREKASNPEEKWKIAREAFSCDVYLSSVNAISEDGQMVNVDGVGNRVAAIAFGPKEVILAVGMNKVVKTLQDALSRARNYASPINVQRLGLNTPCACTGSCEDCKSPESICSYIVVMRNCRPAGRIKVVLIGEDLGF